MPTECTPDFFGFEPVEGREVVAAFDAGSITSDAGALLLGATDRAIEMMDRFASCFHDVRRAELIEHEVVTLVRQRVFGIALGSWRSVARYAATNQTGCRAGGTCPWNKCSDEELATALARATGERP